MTKSAPLFNRLALIGVGLIGSSIARAARAQGAVREIAASARSAATRRRVAELKLADAVVDDNGAAAAGADLVIVCVPVGVWRTVSGRWLARSKSTRTRTSRSAGSTRYVAAAPTCSPSSAARTTPDVPGATLATSASSSGALI